MAQHVVSVSFDYDDEQARARLDSCLYNDVLDGMLEEARNKLPKKKVPVGGEWPPKRSSEVDWERIAGQAVREFLAENRDEIVEEAVKRIAMSANGTKAVKAAKREARDEA